MKQIDALLNRHQGSRAWLFGKGPGLDVFSFQDAGGLRICVNESVLVVPKPTYFFAHDERPIRNAARAWPSHCAAVLQSVRAELARQCSIPEDLIFVYCKRYCDNRVRDMDAEEMARHRSLYGNSGTAHCAIHFCRLIGATGVTLVGFDGAGGYASKLRLPPGGAQHERIRRDCISLLEAMGMPYEFFQPGALADSSERRAQA